MKEEMKKELKLLLKQFIEHFDQNTKDYFNGEVDKIVDKYSMEVEEW